MHLLSPDPNSHFPERLKFYQQLNLNRAVI